MTRPLRYVTPWQVVEVTTRTIQSRFLRRPSAELNAAILAELMREADLAALTLADQTSYQRLGSKFGPQCRLVLVGALR